MLSVESLKVVEAFQAVVISRTLVRLWNLSLLFGQAATVSQIDLRFTIAGAGALLAAMLPRVVEGRRPKRTLSRLNQIRAGYVRPGVGFSSPVLPGRSGFRRRKGFREHDPTRR